MKLTQLIRERIARRRRRTQRASRFKDRFSAALSVQSLESRRLLSATTSLSLDAFGNLLINDIVTGGRNDTLTIQSNTANSRYVLSGGAGSEFSTSIAGAIGNGTSTVEIPFASVTGSKIIANTGEGNDSVTLSFTLGTTFGKDIEARLGDGQDTFSTSGTGSVNSLTIDGELGTDTINFNTDTSFTTAAGLSATAETINVAASADLVVSASNGSITLTSDNIAIATTATLNTGATGTVTLQQQTAGREIRLGADVSPTTLNLADAELDRVTASTLNLGNASSGSVVVTAAISQAGKSVNLVTGGNLEYTGAGAFDVSTAGSSFTVTTGSTSGIVTSNATQHLKATNLTLNVGSGGIGSSTSNVGVTSTNFNSTTANNANQFLRSVGTTTISNLNAGSGTIRLDAGTFNLATGGTDRINDATTLHVNSTAIFGLAGASETVQGVILTGGTIGPTGVLTSNTPFDLRSGDVTAVLSGNVNVVKSTVGTVTLSGINTFTGKVLIDEGTLSINNDRALGALPGAFIADAITVNAGATLATSASLTINANRGILLGSTVGAGTANISANAGTLTYNGILANRGTGTASLNKQGAGILTLGGSNTYSGSTIISSGTLNISSDSNLGALPSTPTPSNLIIDGGILTATGSFEINSNRGIALGSATGSGTGIISVAGTLTYNGIIADNGTGADSLEKQGSGTLILNGLNTYTGTTTLIGTLETSQLANGGQSSGIGASSSAVGNLVLGSGASAGTLRYTGSGASTDRLFTVGTSSTTADTTIDSSGTGALQFTNTGSLVFTAGSIHDLVFLGSNTGNNVFAPVIPNHTGATSVFKDGVGQWQFSGSNTYTGNTTLAQGTLVVSSHGQYRSRQ